MAKKRVRRLVVGGDEYLWTGRIGHVGTGAEVRRCVHLRILAGRRAVLPVVMVSAGPLGPWGAATDCSYPTPGTVRAVLELALAEGWDPRAPDPGFAMLGALDGWELYAPEDEHPRYWLYQRLLAEALPADELALLARIMRDPDPAMAAGTLTWQLDRRAEELLGDAQAFHAWAEQLGRIGADFHRAKLAEWELFRTVTAGEPWSEAALLTATDRSQRQLAERAVDPAALDLLAREGRTRRVRNRAAARLAESRRKRS
ncbi:hypothetical protein [Kitasatospora terrestris]|uniref:hypothetical protein n=1 Tax=Kitasatospora terrestris TaxID=258051 RepID=UPI0031EB9633